MRSWNLLFLVLSIVTQLPGQDNVQTAPRFGFGLSVEAGYSGISAHTVQENPYSLGVFTHSTKQERRPGYAAGLWGSFWLNHRYQILLGVNYSQWRMHLEIEGQDISNNNAVRSYWRERYNVQQALLRIPLEGRVYLGRADRQIRPFLSLGIQASYLLKQTHYAEVFLGGTGEEPWGYGYMDEIDLKQAYFDIRRWQWSLITGLGIQMDRVSLSINGNWALSNNKVNKDDIYRYQYDYCSYGGGLVGDDYSVCNSGIAQFRQTSLRFSYLLF